MSTSWLCSAATIGIPVRLTSPHFVLIYACGQLRPRTITEQPMLKLTESDASELTLDSYLMHIYQTNCLRCGSGERYGQLFEVWTHPTKTRLSGFRELRPARGALRDLPIAYVEMPERANPICSDCVHTYQSPTNKPTRPLSSQEWAETLKRKYTPEPKVVHIARKSEDRTIPAPTPDQL